MAKFLLVPLYSSFVWLIFRLYSDKFFNENRNKSLKLGVNIISNWLFETVDLTEHHFQYCRTCGYFLALSKQQNYCLESDFYKLLHPKTILEDFVVFRDYGGKDLARQLIQQQMFDSIPSFFQTGRQNFTRPFQLPLTTSVLYPYAKNYFRTHQLGTEGGCLFQKYFHVPGQEELALKSNLSNHFRNYRKRLEYYNKSEECLADSEYQKKTYRMWVYEECKFIFDELNSKEYQMDLKQNGIKYIFKTNRHLGNGIILLDGNTQNILRYWYENGNRCGKNNSQVIVQEYIRNPYLYNGHKMEFRFYFSIASTNPNILYGYKKALIKQCGLAFDLKQTTKEAHVCNTAVTKTLKEDFKDDPEDSLYIDWNLEELQELLLDQGRIVDRDWLSSFLYPQIFRKVTHLFLSVEEFMLKDSRVGEFFGVDFIMDDELKLWILECNRNPNFLAVTEGRKEKFGRLIPDMLEIEMQYARSRYMRVREFLIGKLVPAMEGGLQGGVREEMKREFYGIMQDKLESEFQLSDQNQAVLIYVQYDEGEEKRVEKSYLLEEC